MIKPNNPEVLNILVEALDKIKEATGLSYNAKLEGKRIIFYDEDDNDLTIPNLTFERLEDAILDTFGSNNRNILRQKERYRNNVDMRKIFSHIARHNNFTTVAIGKYINRDHTTVIDHIKKCRALLSTDEKFFEKYTEVCKKLKEYHAPTI